MPSCPECERLEEEERQASRKFVACNNALTALIDRLGPIEKLSDADLDERRKLGAAVFAAHERLQLIRQRAREHRHAHSGPPPTPPPSYGSK